MPSRRRVLATLGTTLLAGCETTGPGTQTSMSRTATGSDTPTATSSSTPSTSSTSSSTATSETTTPTPSIETINARRSFVYLYSTTHHGAYTSPDTTFVFARASAAVDRDEYALRVGDIERSARREVGGQSVDSLRDGIPEGDGTLIAFTIEGAVAPADATIHGPGGVTPLPDDARETLRNPPSVTVNGFQVPDRASRGSNVTATLTLQNTGGSTGLFLGNLGSTALSGQSVRTIEVPSESTRTAELEVSLFEEGETETIRCWWGVDLEERTIELTD